MARNAARIIGTGERGMTGHALQKAVPHVRFNPLTVPLGTTVLFPDRYLRGYAAWLSANDADPQIPNAVQFGRTAAAISLATTAKEQFEQIFTKRQPLTTEELIEIFDLGGEMMIKRWSSWGCLAPASRGTYHAGPMRDKFMWVPFGPGGR
jgi:hypothetical protein